MVEVLADGHFPVDNLDSVVCRVDVTLDCGIFGVSSRVGNSLLKIFNGRESGSGSSEHGFPDLTEKYGRSHNLLSLAKNSFDLAKDIRILLFKSRQHA